MTCVGGKSFYEHAASLGKSLIIWKFDNQHARHYVLWTDNM
jgi:hypothetical protein